MAVSVGDILRIAVRMSGPDGQDIINVYHALVELLADGDNDNVLADWAALIQTIYNALAAAVSSDQDGRDISVLNLTNGEVLGTTAFPSGWQGTATGETLPATVSLYSLFRTGLSRRIGKKYWGITTEGVQADGAVTLSGAITALTNTIAMIITTKTGATTTNEYHIGTYNESLAPQFVKFNEAVYRGNLRTQRRRYLGVGS